jgi:hypothetical protein
MNVIALGYESKTREEVRLKIRFQVFRRRRIRCQEEGTETLNLNPE